MKAPPDLARLALAKATAQTILLRERIMKPPVPVKELLEQFAVVHFFEHQNELSFCFEQDSIWYVFINVKTSEQSLNFILAHELGHLFMNHLGIDQTRLTLPQFQLLKREADFFAENLLMPEDWVRSACEDCRINESSLSCLAGYFEVNSATMNRRICHLGIDCSFDAHN